MRHRKCKQFHNKHRYFNPRTREGCDYKRLESIPVPRSISIHAPAKGATAINDLLTEEQVISIHAPAKGATFEGKTLEVVYVYFNPRTREGCDQVRKLVEICGTGNFNPRTREGCDYLKAEYLLAIKISIHAPAKGATLPFEKCVETAYEISIHAPAKGATQLFLLHEHTFFISIHAPAKGATCFIDLNPSIIINFNPRTREGCDIEMCVNSDSDQEFQSTHPRRVRQFFYKLLICLVLFQSTHPRRVRLNIIYKQIPNLLFQSTHPRRVRPTRQKERAILLNFNPRTREGCDICHVITSFLTALFQSTHPRRVRHLSKSLILSSFIISIHAPAKGATFEIEDCYNNFIISIHAPAKGATRLGLTQTEFARISIHAPAKGATLTFSPRPPRE